MRETRGGGEGGRGLGEEVERVDGKLSEKD